MENIITETDGINNTAELPTADNITERESSPDSQSHQELEKRKLTEQNYCFYLIDKLKEKEIALAIAEAKLKVYEDYFKQ